MDLNNGDSRFLTLKIERKNISLFPIRHSRAYLHYLLTFPYRLSIFNIEIRKQKFFTYLLSILTLTYLLLYPLIHIYMSSISFNASTSSTPIIA